MNRVLTLLLLLLIPHLTIAQSEESGPKFLDVSSWNFSLGVGGDLPMGDMADRFGANLAFKGQVERQLGNNWLFAIQYDYIFGNTVKEDVFENLRLNNGNILGTNNTYAVALQRQRGSFLGLSVGKFIPLSSKYKSGLKISLSGGLFENHIRLVDDERSFNQINGDYIKGYDRQVRGFGVKEFVGWQYLSEDKRINFYMGLEFTQAFTSSVRAYDFDTALPVDDSSRFDGGIGFRIGWILPFYSGYEDTEVFY